MRQIAVFFSVKCKVQRLFICVRWFYRTPCIVWHHVCVYLSQNCSGQLAKFSRRFALHIVQLVKESTNLKSDFIIDSAHSPINILKNTHIWYAYCVGRERANISRIRTSANRQIDFVFVCCHFVFFYFFFRIQFCRSAFLSTFYAQTHTRSIRSVDLCGSHSLA